MVIEVVDRQIVLEEGRVDAIGAAEV